MEIEPAIMPKNKVKEWDGKFDMAYTKPEQPHSGAA